MAYVYLAKELLQGEFNKQKEEGIYKMQTASFSQAFQMIASGEISDAQSIATISIAAIHEGII
jgi:putative Ca2+/H+ antiporter (TMEM165/GDT1 family)